MQITINKQKIKIHEKIDLSTSQLKNVQNWIKALLSGRYEQGKGVLHSSLDNKYCCLGVVCDVLGVREKKDDECYIFGTSKDSSNVSLPKYVMEKLGMAGDEGQAAFSDSGKLVLTYLNDHGSSFNKIAKILMKDLQNNARGYFKQKKS